MTMPNFLIIGAGKSGTTALWRYVRQHPEIYMSPKKEPHFFSFETVVPYDAGPGDYTKHAITDLESYQALFNGASDEPVLGEASTTSLYRNFSAKRRRMIRRKGVATSGCLQGHPRDWMRARGSSSSVASRISALARTWPCSATSALLPTDCPRS